MSEMTSGARRSSRDRAVGRHFQRIAIFAAATLFIFALIVIILMGQWPQTKARFVTRALHALMRDVWPRMISLLCVSWLSVALSPPSQSQPFQGAHPPSPNGHILGHIDYIHFERDNFYVWGWACELGKTDSVNLHIYADRSASDKPKGTFVLSAVANLESEPAVNRACQDTSGGKHRFHIELPNPILSIYQGRKLYLHGLLVASTIEDAALTGSGAVQFPKPPVFRNVPTTYPHLSGSYRSSEQHPRIFTTPEELNDLVGRINTPGTFSAQSFARLARRIKADLAGKVDWDATYFGCDIDVYLHAFSIEPRGGYASEIRSEDQLRAAMNTKAGASIPAGAAVVASRLALYAALVKAGAAAAADAPPPDRAIALAKRILLAWADRGFRDERGRFRQSAAQFCDAVGRPGDWGAVALQISRGVVYSVHAQDLLLGLGAFGPDEEARLDTFHGAMNEAIRTLSNEEFDVASAGRYPDEIYNNQFASHLTGLFATARLLDDRKRFDAALYGGEGTTAVRLPWVSLFDHAIYGPSDTPLLRITPNSSADPLTSKPAYSTATVAAGEINDRYRNDNPLQGIGYPIGTLKSFFDAAEILRIAGFDPYAYRGAHRQSIEMATQYYACYCRYVGFYKMVTAENARSCPNYQQYVGKVVNQVEPAILIGAYRFPQNESITNAEAAARTAGDSLDAIRFGKWRQ